MYSLLTSALLFVLLAPGFLVTLPPGATIVTAAIVHGIVFYVIQTYLSTYIPWWAIWVAVIAMVAIKVISSRSQPPPAMGVF